MKRIASCLLVSLVLLPACGGEKTPPPTPAPAKPAANPPPVPAESPKPPPETPKPDESVKPPTETPKAPAETPAAPEETTKPPSESAQPPGETAKAPAESSKPAETPKEPTGVDMDAAAKELMAKPEQPDESISIQHILISFEGAPRMTGVTRSKDDAKVLAQKVFAEAIGGGDFAALVKQYTNDSSPGIYPLTKAGRAGMVKSFGDVGFRLKVGEIGVAVWDAAASPYGWHIIKRLK